MLGDDERVFVVILLRLTSGSEVVVVVIRLLSMKILSETFQDRVEVKRTFLFNSQQR